MRLRLRAVGRKPPAVFRTKGARAGEGVGGRWQGPLPAGCRHAAEVASGWAGAPGYVARPRNYQAPVSDGEAVLPRAGCYGTNKTDGTNATDGKHRGALTSAVRGGEFVNIGRFFSFFRDYPLFSR